jgi:hypothetical protein
VSMSTNGLMAYGYDFGDPDGLLLREAQKGPGNEYGYFKASWWDDENEEDAENDEDEEAPSLVERMTRRLYDSIPDAPPAEYDFQREEIVKERLGVWFEAYCSGDYAMYILATAEFCVYRGDTKVIDLDRLRDDPARGGWDEKLAEALRILDVHPLQQRPAWLLASWWG